MTEYKGIYYDIIDRTSDIISSELDMETSICRTNSFISALRQLSDLSSVFVDKLERFILYQGLDKSEPLELRIAYLKKIVIEEKCLKDTERLNAVYSEAINQFKNNLNQPEINYPVKKKNIQHNLKTIDLKKLSSEVINHMKKLDNFSKFTTNSWRLKPFESDILGYTKDKKIHEFEIKTSKNDLKNDFKKACSSTGKNKHDLIKNGDLADYFWFVIPSHLYQQMKEYIPDYCGVLSFVINHNYDILFIEEVVKAIDLKKGF